MQTDLLLQAFKDRLAELGFELVDLKIGGAKHRPLVRVRIDVLPGIEGRAVTDGDCVRASRALEAWLDAEQPLGDRYILEVSSPGIERPIRWIEHWQRYAGQDVNIRLRGRAKFRARIVGVPDDRHVTVESGEHGTETLALETIREATLAYDW